MKENVVSPPPQTAQEGERHLNRWLSQLRGNHQRLRIFGIMKTFSSELRSLENLQKITDIRWDIMICYHGKPDQLDSTQASFKTPVCSVTCFPQSPVPLVQSVSCSPTQWHFAEITLSNIRRCSCKPCCLLHRRVSDKRRQMTFSLNFSVQLNTDDPKVAQVI